MQGAKQSGLPDRAKAEPEAARPEGKRPAIHLPKSQSKRLNTTDAMRSSAAVVNNGNVGSITDNHMVQQFDAEQRSCVFEPFRHFVVFIAGSQDP